MMRPKREGHGTGLVRRTEVHVYFAWTREMSRKDSLPVGQLVREDLPEKRRRRHSFVRFGPFARPRVNIPVGSIKVLDIDLPNRLDAAAAARHALAGLSDGFPRQVFDDLTLLVSEVVTNSLRHAHLSSNQNVALQIWSWDHRIRVEVKDPGPGFDPAIGEPSSEQQSGWGLYLVDQVSDKWGVEHAIDSTVWFEMFYGLIDNEA